MKITHILFRQHIGRHFKEYWWQKSKILITQSGVEEELRKKNIPVYQPDDILNEKTVPEKYF